MKIGTVLIGCLFLCNSAVAQSTWFNEWFRQKSTQRKYLINQIAALEVYIGYAKKGYDIYKTGLNTIGSITNGEFVLHKDFFLSLKGINPQIARYARVADIINLQLQVIKTNSRSMRMISKGNHLRQEELAYVGRVHNKLLENCGQIVDELIVLTTAGRLEMEDDERLQRIDKVYEEMKGNYGFAEEFSNGSLQLWNAREKQERDIAVSRSLHKTK